MKQRSEIEINVRTIMIGHLNSRIGHLDVGWNNFSTPDLYRVGVTAFGPNNMKLVNEFHELFASLNGSWA